MSLSTSTAPVLGGWPPRGSKRDPPYAALKNKEPRTRRGSGSRMEVNQKARSEEHTSELQSRENLVCRLLLEKKKEKTVVRHYGQKHTTDCEWSATRRQ